ncbi:hypothetical protein [Streptomyces europaeiscabiei]|uniref:hypothetical protein n=1 Tax=Streptomyces europaeiscabiei TaxID=146819 RepID=UPI0029A5270C|nr:hypothetical protein [Streptomyces europaeiscabiei]MDX3695049.1 hypothetical protein [Streptomyces europaeiscabiei]
MVRYRNRPNAMFAAPIVTLPTVIARHACADLLDRPDPAWHRLAHLITPQLFPGSTRHTLTLAPTDLHDLLAVLLDIVLDFYAGGLSPQSCGFTEADIREVIDLHHHHYPAAWDF